MKKIEETVTYLQKCILGDRMAFKAIYEFYHPKLYYVISRYIENDWDAEDLLSTAFVKAFQNLHVLENADRFYPWLKKISINLCLDHLRKTKTTHYSWEESLEIQFFELPEVINTIGEQEILELIRKMPEGYRTVFNLSIIEGYTHQEIADMLGCSTSNTKTQLMKSKAWLKAKLEKTYE